MGHFHRYVFYSLQARHRLANQRDEPSSPFPQPARENPRKFLWPAARPMLREGVCVATFRDEARHLFLHAQGAAPSAGLAAHN